MVISQVYTTETRLYLFRLNEVGVYKSSHSLRYSKLQFRFAPVTQQSNMLKVSLFSFSTIFTPIVQFAKC